MGAIKDVFESKKNLRKWLHAFTRKNKIPIWSQFSNQGNYFNFIDKIFYNAKESAIASYFIYKDNPRFRLFLWRQIFHGISD